MWILIGIVAILATLTYYYIKQSLGHWRNRNVKQRDIATILKDIWNVFFGSEDFLAYWQNVYQESKNDRYLGVYQFGQPMLMIRDQELIKAMTVKDFEHFTNHREFASEDADPIWARNLLALKGDKWRAMRATLSPAFTGSKMRGMFTLIDDAAKKYVDFYKTGPAQFSFECKDSFTRLANDVIATCAFGVQVNSLKEPKNEFYMAGKEATNFGGFIRTIKFLLSMTSPFLRSLLKVSLFSKSVQTFYSNLIKSTIKYRETNNVVRPDMIHLLLEARKGILKEEDDSKDLHQSSGTFSMLETSNLDGPRNEKLRLTELTDMDITAQAAIFISGGFDSVATALSFATYELAVHTDIQERLRAEIQESFTANNGQLTYQSILTMRYLDMVLSESLRKWPPGIILDRVCSKTYTIPQDPENYNEKEVTLNPGDVLLVNAIGIHRDPEIYPEPEKFNPERFNDENKHKITPYNYMPFGVGPRHCIAIRFALMEIKTVLAHLLLNFELFATEKTEIPMKVARTLSLNAKNGFWIGLKRID